LGIPWLENAVGDHDSCKLSNTLAKNQMFPYDA
jgi:hypothetical protein